MTNPEQVTCRTSGMLLLSLESNSPDCSGVRGFKTLPNQICLVGWAGGRATPQVPRNLTISIHLYYFPQLTPGVDRLRLRDSRLKEGIFKGVTTACDAAAVAAAALPLAAASVAHLASASASQLQNASEQAFTQLHYMVCNA